MTRKKNINLYQTQFSQTTYNGGPLWFIQTLGACNDHASDVWNLAHVTKAKIVHSSRVYIYVENFRHVCSCFILM